MVEVYPPLFATASVVSAVRAIFGTNPVRIYPIGDAPSKGEADYAVPYATFQTVAGSPENYLSGRPDAAEFREQVDVMAPSLTEARAGAKAIMEAVELVAQVASFNGNRRDPDSNLVVYSFDIAWITTGT